MSALLGDTFTTLVDRRIEAEMRADRYERLLKAIAASTLTGTDFGDWVQEQVTNVLDGLEAECGICGTAVHEGPCVGDGDDATE